MGSTSIIFHWFYLPFEPQAVLMEAPNSAADDADSPVDLSCQSRPLFPMLVPRNTSSANAEGNTDSLSENHATGAML